MIDIRKRSTIIINASNGCGSTYFSMTTDIASYTAWTAWGKVYADYIDGDGYMYILANLTGANQYLNVDYIKLSVVW